MPSKDLDITSKIDDPIIKRNYQIVKNQIIGLLDKGLDYLRQIYLKENSDTSFKEFTAQNYFDFVLRDYIRRKIIYQLKIILKTAILCLPHYQNESIDQNFLDNLINQRYSNYAEDDLTLLHSSSSHPARNELQNISKLTFRIYIIQTIYLIAVKEPEIQNYQDLVKHAFLTKKKCENSLNAILSMQDQMIDCFERNLDIVNIPFYKPTWNIRDFRYVRIIYEYALKNLNGELNKINFDGYINSNSDSDTQNLPDQDISDKNATEKIKPKDISEGEQ
ncbi:MAG: hypothetical protein ACTSVU_04470 [Promethearchaeota archaeon]